MDTPRVAGILTSVVPSGPGAGPVRLARLADLARLFGPEWWLGPEREGIVAAALALLEGVPRVVVATDVAALSEVAVIAVAGRDAAVGLTLEGPPVLVDLAAAGAPPPGRVRAVHPGGQLMLPGARRPLRVGGAAIALPLMFGRPMLGPLVELDPPGPNAAPEGVLVLRAVRAPRSAPRISLPPGESPIAAPANDRPEDPRHADGPEAARIGAALDAIAQRYAHRLEQNHGAIATLERDVERVLQAEAAAGAIAGYAFTVEPVSSGARFGLTGAGRAGVGDDFAIEVVLRLPKRVGQVIVRTSRL